MAAGIIANGVTEILKKLSSVVVNEITLVWDFNDELKNLQSTLNMILDVMEDAEKKQLSQAPVRRWMEELKAIAYDAEDILDEYYYEVNHCKHQKSTVFNKVRNIFSNSKPSFKVIRKLAHQIKEINENFNKIAKRTNDLGLQTKSDSLVVTDWKNIASLIGGIDMADIARSLQNAFKGKKFILVLDDVWNEKPADWNNFKKPFMVGREGSKILVTTRNEKVALIMVDKFKPYPLGILKENDCWSLFKEIAFESAAGVIETPNLVEIGKEMVKRCRGLPLAVIFLGSLMRTKKKEEEWKIIRDTKLWHKSHDGKNSEILPSLRLSYDYLPSHLKLCFSYCCLFPKDFEIHRETLIRLWMAEGFLIETPEENTMSMEEIGNEYFDSLLSSFFFQDVEKDENGDIRTCKMHDLVHDLARSVVGNYECLIVENALGIDYISEATRRLNLLVDLCDKEMFAKVLEALKKAKRLRTVFVNNQIFGLYHIRNATAIWADYIRPNVGRLL